jgi:hypothetical protein
LKKNNILFNGGKGSVKEGKIGRKDGQPLPGEDEPLHAYVTANNPENVKKAVEKVRFKKKKVGSRQRRGTILFFYSIRKELDVQVSWTPNSQVNIKLFSHFLDCWQ